MTLPKIQLPTYTITVPSTQKTERFRPFTVREEKMLLTAKEDTDDSAALNAMKQIIDNCALDDKFDVDSLAVFDVEYLYLKIWSFSVDSVIKLSYKDYEDEKVRDFDVDLSKIEVEFPQPPVKSTVQLSNTVSIAMRYPPATLYGDKTFIDMAAGDQTFELVLRCISAIADGDEVHEATAISRRELEEFVDSLDKKTFDKIQAFLYSTPRMRHVIEYTNDLGNKRTITLSGLNDFFGQV